MQLSRSTLPSPSSSESSCFCIQWILDAFRALSPKKKDTTVTDMIRIRMNPRSGQKTSSGHGDLDFRQLLLAPDPARAITNRYTDFVQIGKGGFGSVWKTTSRHDGHIYAVKQVPKSDVEEDQVFVYTELEAMIKLDHPNVVKFFEFFEEPDTLLLITELCDGGDFSDMKDSVSDPAEIKQLFKDVLMGVAYCHDLGVAHRDLKFENCLISKIPGYRRVAKVIDFGLSAIMRPGDTAGQWLNHQLGTKYFVAPEVIDGRKNYGVKCDCWSIGVMLYIILTDEHPCAAKAHRLETAVLFRKVVSADIRISPLEEAGFAHEEDPARDLCLKLLVRRPDQRLTAQEALKHPWFAEGDVGWELPGSDEQNIPHGVTSELVGRIRTFGECARFEKAILTLVAHQAHCTEVEDLRCCFSNLDSAQNGSLTKSEIKTGLQNAGKQMTDQQIDTLFRSLDLDRSGKVFYTEWLAATMKPSIVASEKAMRHVFDFLDIECNGKVSCEELMQVLGSEAEAAAMIQHADIAGDGCLSWEEFKVFMTELSRKMEVNTKHVN